MKALNEIAMTLDGVDNEYTRSPYWLILDPEQNMSRDIHVMAQGISGPFFCRRDAEDYLKRCRYNFSDRAQVYCLSGYMSNKYNALCDGLGV